MITIHAAILVPKDRRDYGFATHVWGPACRRMGVMDGPISDQVERVTCEDCKRIIKQKGIVL